MDRALYNEILELLESRLHPGAILLGADADMCPDYCTFAQVMKPA